LVHFGIINDLFGGVMTKYQKEKYAQAEAIKPFLEDVDVAYAILKKVFEVVEIPELARKDIHEAMYSVFSAKMSIENFIRKPL
jgi:hypothetical protein